MAITSFEKHDQRIKDFKALAIAKSQTYPGKTMYSPDGKTRVFAKPENFKQWEEKGYTFTRKL